MSQVAIGISEHLGWAWFVVVTIESGDAILLGSGRMALVDLELPCMPFHHDTDGMEIEAADELLGKVRDSAWERAFAALSGVKEALKPGHSLVSLAIRQPPLASLPDSVAASRKSYHINCRADGMLYHQAICAASERLKVAVVFHRRGEEEESAARRLAIDLDVLKVRLATLGKGASRWTKEHRQAAAAAIAAL